MKPAQFELVGLPTKKNKKRGQQAEQDKKQNKTVNEKRDTDLVGEVKRHCSFERFLVENGTVDEGHQQRLPLCGRLCLLPHRNPNLLVWAGGGA